MPEYWDIYDKDRRKTGRFQERGKPPASPEDYHLVVEIWTVNRQGQILLTLRDPQKDAYPGLWEVTGGSALAGETSRRAACRELREETAPAGRAAVDFPEAPRADRQEAAAPRQEPAQLPSALTPPAAVPHPGMNTVFMRQLHFPLSMRMRRWYPSRWMSWIFCP